MSLLICLAPRQSYRYCNLIPSFGESREAFSTSFHHAEHSFYATFQMETCSSCASLQHGRLIMCTPCKGEEKPHYAALYMGREAPTPEWSVQQPCSPQWCRWLHPCIFQAPVLLASSKGRLILCFVVWGQAGFPLQYAVCSSHASLAERASCQGG